MARKYVIPARKGIEVPRPAPHNGDVPRKGMWVEYSRVYWHKREREGDIRSFDQVPANLDALVTEGAPKPPPPPVDDDESESAAPAAPGGSPATEKTPADDAGAGGAAPAKTAAKKS